MKMKKPDLNSKTLFTLAGAAVMVGSLITIVDFAERKRKSKPSHVGELIAGIAGLAVGVALTSEPDRRARRSVVVDDMFTDEDVELANEQIRETLNNGVDRGSQPTNHLRTIEVDSETSIEDFI